jgi:hypothetical protein
VIKHGRQKDPSTWNRRQETNHKCCRICSQWNIVAFTNCVPRDNQLITSPAWTKEKLIFLSNSIWPTTLETTKQFVEHILKPYHVAQVENFALTKNQKMVWLIDWLLVSSQKWKVFWVGWNNNTHVCVCVCVCVCVWYLFQQIAPTPFNLLMLFSNIHSNMHSRKNSIPRLAQQSLTNLNEVRILKLIFKCQF